MMKWLRNKFWRRQEGVAMLMVLGFMAISIPVITGYLAFTGALINDSQTKTRILVKQYQSQGCAQYAAWKLNNDPAYAATFVADPEQELTELPGCSITIVAEPPTLNGEEVYADLSLVLDVSGSVNNSEFEQLRDAANQIVDAFSLTTTAPRVRMAITRFRGSYQVVQVMTDDAVPLHAAIDDLDQGGPGLVGTTNIVAGLDGGAAAFATGLGDRVDPPFQVQNLMIFITDGDDTYNPPSNPHGQPADPPTGAHTDEEIEDASEATGATVFAIGVGDADDIETATINAIATDPDGEHSFSPENFGELLSMIGDITDAVYAEAGTLFTVTSVGPDGIVIITRVFIPAPA